MRCRSIRLPFIAMVAMLAGCSSNPTLFASDDFLTIAGQRWRRTGALNTEILRVGVRRGGPFRRGENAFDSKAMPMLVNTIKVQEVTRAFGKQTWDAAIDATLDPGGSTSVAASGTASGSITGVYHVFRVMDVFELTEKLNLPENRRIVEAMASYGADARIITGVAKVHEQEQRRMIGGSGNVSSPGASIGGTNVSVSLKPSGSFTTVASMSDGTVFAFEYARFCWTRMAAGGAVVVSLEVDRPGSDSDCPEGTYDDARSLPLSTT
jgi:hypothetical protein